jgi:hypothetical protein
MTGGEYREMLRRLNDLDREAAAHRREAVEWHDDRVVAADEAVRAEEENVRAAEHAVRRAEQERDEVDARAAGIWSDYIHGWPQAERYGKTRPDPMVPRQRDRRAEDYLAEAESTTGRTPPQRPLGSATTVMFAAFGFMGGAVGVAAHQTLRWAGREAGGDWAVALPVLALIVLLVGPVLAVFGAKRVADRRGVGLDAAAVSTVLLTGLVTAGLLWTALRGQA